MKNIINILCLLFCFGLVSDTTKAQTYTHLHYVALSEASIIALGASNSATPGQVYYAIDTYIYYTGLSDNSVALLATQLNAIDIDELCGEIPFADKIDYLRYNNGQQTVTDNTVFDNFCNATSSLKYLYFYSFTWIQGMGENLICPTLLRLYQLNGSTNGQPWPEMPMSNSLQFFRVQSDANAIANIPLSWSNAKRLQRIYYQRNGLTTSDVDGLIIELETRIIAGMSSNYGGVHYLYLNGTGTGANASPTTAIHLANGWVNNGSYFSKTIAGQNWRVYKN